MIFTSCLAQYLKNLCGLAFIGFSCAFGVAANAVVIDFDDLVYSSKPVSAYDQPIDDEYAAKGVTFFETYLDRDITTLNQFAFGLGGLYMRFPDALPTRVSFDLFTESVDGLDVHIFGPDGTTYENLFVAGNTYLSLINPNGITRIELVNQQYRTVLGLDNLSITFAVPEPATIVLLVAGLVLISMARRRRDNVYCRDGASQLA